MASAVDGSLLLRLKSVADLSKARKRISCRPLLVRNRNRNSIRAESPMDMATHSQKLGIKVESNPPESKLAQLGVRNWPKKLKAKALIAFPCHQTSVSLLRFASSPFQSQFPRNPRRFTTAFSGSSSSNGDESGRNLKEDELKKERGPVFKIKWAELLLDPDPDNLLAVALTGLLAWASVQVLWQLFFISLAILVAALKLIYRRIIAAIVVRNLNRFDRGFNAAAAAAASSMCLQSNITKIYATASNFRVGFLWGCEPSKFPWTYADEETCYLLKGKVKVTPAGSEESVEIGPGDLVEFPKGMSCTWDVSVAVDKHYKFG